MFSRYETMRASKPATADDGASAVASEVILFSEAFGKRWHYDAVAQAVRPLWTEDAVLHISAASEADMRTCLLQVKDSVMPRVTMSPIQPCLISETGSYFRL